MPHWHPASAWLSAWLKNWRSHGLTLLAILLVYSGTQLWQTRHLPQGMAPEFSAPLSSGETLSLNQWRARHPGRAVALHFWAEWCPICQLEESSISQLQQDWPMLTLAMQSGDARRLQAVLASRGLDWTTVVDADGSLSRHYGLVSVPAFVVLDARGRIRFATIGYTSEIGMRLRLWWAQNF